MSDKEINEVADMVESLLREEVFQRLVRENARLSEEVAGLLSQMVIFRHKIRFLEKAAEK